MKKTSLIIGLLLTAFACNNNADNNTNMFDSSASQAEIATPPGLGSDPTRNDASKIKTEIIDSSIHDNNPGATSGLGSDPTRNDASKARTDTGLKKN